MHQRRPHKSCVGVGRFKLPLSGDRLSDMRYLAAVAVLLLLLPATAWAVAWDFVETDLSLRPDGKATIVYKVAIDPQGMALHGFYFQGYGD